MLLGYEAHLTMIMLLALPLLLWFLVELVHARLLKTIALSVTIFTVTNKG